MHSYLSVPLEDVPYPSTQNDVVTTPTSSEEGSWASFDGLVYPPPPHPPTPRHDESGPLLSVTGVFVYGKPLVNTDNTMPLKSTVSLPGAPASGIFPNDTHSPTRVGSAPIFPVALIPPGTSPIPRPVESREKRKPRVRPRAHRYQKSTLNKKARIPQFFCDNCDADFVQKQGLNRHREHKHRDEYDEPSLCIRCDFKCTRPYEYRAHLEKRHPEVDANLILGKVAGSRRRTAYFARYPSQQVLLPTIDHGRWGDSGIRRYPPTVVKPSIPALPLPDITHVLELESTHLIMMDNVISEGEHAQTTWMAPLGAPQEEYTLVYPRDGTYRYRGPYAYC